MSAHSKKLPLLFEKQNALCHYCGATMTLVQKGRKNQKKSKKINNNVRTTVDHVVPVAFNVVDIFSFVGT